jgi:hypothetical protein
VGGSFSTAGGVAANNIAKYNTATGVEENISKPGLFYLSQNYPNPFNPVTKINYSVPQADFITIKVYDVLGNLIETVVNERKSAGVYETEFDASKFNLTSGIYLCKMMNEDGNSSAIKMLLIK